ncbi:MAG TPA: zinc ribbon domain-containing protein [Pyrinomonadaceae bacterium]|nr:zinc ribbon domain-containing protein [Pyrinomonadaceae bacterium]
MYCPRCGRQASEEVRFCSGCGLPLDDTAALVQAGGRLAPHGDAPDEATRTLTPRARGTRKGLMIMAGGVIFFGLAFFLMRIKEDFFVLLLPAVLVLTIGVMRVLYGLLLEDDSARRKSPGLNAADEHEDARAKLGRVNAAAELPPARTRPASDFAGRTADTADMAPPQSVAEATTKLLEEDAGAGRNL